MDYKMYNKNKHFATRASATGDFPDLFRTAFQRPGLRHRPLGDARREARMQVVRAGPAVREDVEDHLGRVRAAGRVAGRAIAREDGVDVLVIGRASSAILGHQRSFSRRKM